MLYSNLVNGCYLQTATPSSEPEIYSVMPYSEICHFNCQLSFKFGRKVLKFQVDMFDKDFHSSFDANVKQIEDIIDSRKLLGHYNVPKHNSYNFKSKGSAGQSRCLRFEESVLANEGDSLNNSIIKQTDSEITVVRIKCQDSPSKRNKINKWDMHDIAIPGDGSHLAESPSLVNLVTLVGDSRPFECEEYLVPLSSWEPTYKFEEKSTEMRCYSDSRVYQSSSHGEDLGNDLKNENSEMFCGRSKWAGRISKFLRKHCTKTKTICETSTKDQN